MALRDFIDKTIQSVKDQESHTYKLRQNLDQKILQNLNPALKKANISSNKQKTRHQISNDGTLRISIRFNRFDNKIMNDFIKIKVDNDGVIIKSYPLQDPPYNLNKTRDKLLRSKAIQSIIHYCQTKVINNGTTDTLRIESDNNVSIGNSDCLVSMAMPSELRNASETSQRRNSNTEYQYIMNVIICNCGIEDAMEKIKKIKH